MEIFIKIDSKNMMDSRNHNKLLKGALLQGFNTANSTLAVTK
jgi:hypothetical protein